ncbi:MAG: hypothetical protein AABO57_16080 [Acidobacteriota bacterium]
MWQADVQRNVEDWAQLYSSWEGSGPAQVVCLLDPPRNALPPHSYQEAQRNMYNVFDRLPGKESLVVGLQEDFMKELRTAAGLSDNYLDNGGLGIVYALSRAKPPPDAVGLETAGFVEEYRRVENQAIDFMSRSASFFQLVTRAYGEGKKKYSPELLSFLSLVASYRRDHSIGLNAYVSQLLKKARSLSINLGATRYKPLLVFESISRLESEVAKSKNEKLNELVEPLAQAIYVFSQPETIDRRAVWQLKRYLLQAPTGMATTRELDEITEAEIERIEQMLQQDTLPEPPRKVVEKACELVKERCLTDVLLVRPGEDKQDLLGQQGAMITNLLELAAVLGIEPRTFPLISNYVHYLYFNEKLKTITHNAQGRALSDCMAHLEREIAQHLAKSTAEQALVEMDPAIEFMEAMGRYHILHGEEWKKVVIGFSASEICGSLSDLGVALPTSWETRAEESDREFASVRDFFDLSVLRGKDLAGSLCAAMAGRNLGRGVLYCDAYLHDNLARWFQSHDVSYTFLFPRFSVG